MPTQYDPAATEKRRYTEWVDRGYFHTEPGEASEASEGVEPFCMVLPPPNVTGRLHMGHALNHTIPDILARRARMQGRPTLWLPGTDHAGIATQVVVERSLREEGIERRDIGREAFVAKVWEWKAKYGGEIVEQTKALGSSLDWQRLRFTMDEGLSRAVRVAFVRMYEDGLIYRGERLVNWCPKDQTGLSDSEVEHDEVEGELVTFRYRLSEGDGHVDVATTRLETMLGDTGIAVNPADERYSALVEAGAHVKHPFDGRDLPIVADDHVDRAFGTGAVKVTPAHDPNDWEIAERTGLPRINIFNADATLNDAVPSEFRGLDRYEARARVRERLDGLGLLVKEERPYMHAVGHCYRCKSEIEPWVSGLQWFVAVDRLKEPARAAVRDGRIKFTPQRWARAYDTWLEGLKDWNISRQLWWGHRIPVWYCPDGHETAAIEDPSECATCASAQIEQEEDLLDTWFSSQLWPFSTLGWPDEDAPDLKFFYPTTVLVTAYEILYLWVARMIMSGLYLAGDVPFRQVVVHGLVRDAHGHKMSKSLGNVIDPLDMIEKFGADALRFSLARMASPEQQNLPLSEEAIEAARNFANKIWNAARFVLNAGGKPKLPDDSEWNVAERWLLSRHEACRAAVEDALDADRFDEAAQVLHRFLWSEFCDWGLELEKGRLYDGSPEEKADAANVLGWILERTLRLLHPIMPFVTEEIWQRFGAGESIVIARWPEARADLTDAAAEAGFAAAEDKVRRIRAIKKSLPPGQGASVVLDESLRAPLEPWIDGMQRVTQSSLEFGDVGTREVQMQLAPGTDAAPVIAHLDKKLTDVQAKLQRKRKKLENKGFVSKAAPEIVEGERADVTRLTEEEAVLLAQLEQFRAAG